jgi:PBP1b-binding outer membrane lipoprotein LpoB
MKRILFTFIIATLFLTSCATHSGIPRNYIQNSTEVVLTKKNFKVIKIVKGEAETSYFFGFGGLSKNGLVAEAKADMLASAELEGNSRTIINEVVEVKRSGIFFLTKHKVIVSGQVIEFTE